MGKPLSRPDCLRQNPTCLGKGDDEDGYIEDCYVPQRSIYDTMRINEQIDQGPKAGQPSKGTIERAEGSTLSSNGTLEAANLFEPKAPEAKKLDERVIFDALKLSSDAAKPAPVPPRRKPIPERKENLNRRSWKSFMPPNFPEFAERMEASLSEVSEAGVSNPSLQDRGESSPLLAGDSSRALHSESVTLEHVAKTSNALEVQKASQRVSDECLRFYSSRYQDEYADGDCQPLLEQEHPLMGTTCRPEDQRLPSATWPRALKGVLRGALGEGHPEGCEAVLEDSLLEMAPLSPCLSEELLDAGTDILITPNLREKTFSELRFEEDERRIMMEAEEEWEEDSLSERMNCCLAGISEESELLPASHRVQGDVDYSPCVPFAGPTSDGREVCAPCELDKSCSSSFTQDTHLEYDCSFSDSLAHVFTHSATCDGAAPCEQDSDADSDQMFLELEKQCLEEDKDGSGENEADGQECSHTVASSVFAEAPGETDACSAPLEPSVTDSAIVSDVEDFDASGHWEAGASQQGLEWVGQTHFSSPILKTTSSQESTDTTQPDVQEEHFGVVDQSPRTVKPFVQEKHCRSLTDQSQLPVSDWQDVSLLGWPLTLQTDTLGVSSSQDVLHEHGFCKPEFDESPVTKCVKMDPLKDDIDKPQASSLNFEPVDISHKHPVEQVFTPGVNFQKRKATVHVQQRKDEVWRKARSSGDPTDLLDGCVAELGSAHYGASKDRGRSGVGTEITSLTKDISEQVSEVNTEILEYQGHGKDRLCPPLHIVPSKKTQDSHQLWTKPSAGLDVENVALGGSNRSHFAECASESGQLSLSESSIFPSRNCNNLVSGAIPEIPLTTGTLVAEELISTLDTTQKHSVEELHTRESSTIVSEAKVQTTEPSPTHSFKEKPPSAHHTEDRSFPTQCIVEQPSPTHNIPEHPSASQCTEEQPSSTQSIEEQPSPIQNISEQSSPTRSIAEQPSVTHDITEHSFPTVSVEELPYPIQSIAEQPSLKPSIAEQPSLKPSIAEQPSSTKNITELSSPTQSITEQRSPTQGIEEKPSSAQGITEQPSPIQGIEEKPSAQSITEQPSPTQGIRDRHSTTSCVTEQLSPTHSIAEHPSPTHTTAEHPCPAQVIVVEPSSAQTIVVEPSPTRTIAEHAQPTWTIGEQHSPSQTLVEKLPKTWTIEVDPSPDMPLTEIPKREDDTPYVPPSNPPALFASPPGKKQLSESTSNTASCEHSKDSVEHCTVQISHAAPSTEGSNSKERSTSYSVMENPPTTSSFLEPPVLTETVLAMPQEAEHCPSLPLNTESSPSVSPGTEPFLSLTLDTEPPVPPDREPSHSVTLETSCPASVPQDMGPSLSLPPDTEPSLSVAPDTEPSHSVPSDRESSLLVGTDTESTPSVPLGTDLPAMVLLDTEPFSYVSTGTKPLSLPPNTEPSHVSPKEMYPFPSALLDTQQPPSLPPDTEYSSISTEIKPSSVPPKTESPSSVSMNSEQSLFAPCDTEPMYVPEGTELSISVQLGTETPLASFSFAAPHQSLPPDTKPPPIHESFAKHVCKNDLLTSQLGKGIPLGPVTGTPVTVNLGQCIRIEPLNASQSLEALPVAVPSVEDQTLEAPIFAVPSIAAMTLEETSVSHVPRPESAFKPSEMISSAPYAEELPKKAITPENTFFGKPARCLGGQFNTAIALDGPPSPQGLFITIPSLDGPRISSQSAEVHPLGTQSLENLSMLAQSGEGSHVLTWSPETTLMATPSLDGPPRLPCSTDRPLVASQSRLTPFTREQNLEWSEVPETSPTVPCSTEGPSVAACSLDGPPMVGQSILGCPMAAQIGMRYPTAAHSLDGPTILIPGAEQPSTLAGSTEGFSIPPNQKEWGPLTTHRDEHSSSTLGTTDRCPFKVNGLVGPPDSTPILNFQLEPTPKGAPQARCSATSSGVNKTTLIAHSTDSQPVVFYSLEGTSIMAYDIEGHPYSKVQSSIAAHSLDLSSCSSSNVDHSSIPAHSIRGSPVAAPGLRSFQIAAPIQESPLNVSSASERTVTTSLPLDESVVAVPILEEPLIADVLLEEHAIPACGRESPSVTAAEFNHEHQTLIPTDGVYLYNEAFQKERVEPLQSRLQQVNGLGQGLIQSAEKSSDVHGLEHDTEELSTRWNMLSKKVAERVAQLQEALLHCGKFQDALEPLLSWLTDTEELIANQKPPSAEYKVVKAQIQEQKLLQRLLDDRRATVEMIQAEGSRIAESAEPADCKKIYQNLDSLAEQWARLLSQAATRKNQLDDILVLAQQFHESVEPISDWLSTTEKKLANYEPIGTQTPKIEQQIARHKAMDEEVSSREAVVLQALALGDSLSSLSCPADRTMLTDRLASLLARYDEVRDRCGRKGELLEQALVNAQLFGEDEVELLNWLGEMEDKLSLVTVKDYRCDVLHAQHALQLALNEEILYRKKNVDQAIKNGQSLLKQTTGEDVLLVQEKLDGIKTRYSEITAASAKTLRTLEQARQLATKFQSTHEELNTWIRKVEEELASTIGFSPVGEQIPQFQQRQKELKKEVMEQRLVLDTVNEVSIALLELVPWRAREGLDKLVSEANEQYKSISDTVGQRVDQIDAAIQRSQQYEQATDAELAWVAETKRKLLALGPIRLEQDQTTAQLQVQKAFSIDIIRHKDSMDELLNLRDEILGACVEEQKAVLQEKTQALIQRYEEVGLLNSERYAGLERAQALVAQFWETHGDLSPWLEETQGLIELLPSPAVDPELLRQQQEDLRLLRESIAEHKPHIDKLLKIGPQLEQLNSEEGQMVQERYSSAERAYTKIRDEVRQRAVLLDEAVAQAAQFHDKIEPMLESLETLASRLRSAPLIPAEVEKIRDAISDNKNALMELEKLQPSFEALKRRGEELIRRSQGIDKDPAAKAVQDRLDQMLFLWGDIKARAEEREQKFLDALELAEKFWYDMAALLTTLKDTQDIIHDLESPGIDPSLIKQQLEAAEAIKEETDGLHDELEFIRILGTDLIFACGETEKPEVKKSIDEMNNAWENLNKTWRDRLDCLEEAMLSAVQYQDTLQAMFDWLDNAVIKLCDMSPVGTDLDTVKDQIHEMKEFKVEVYQQQIEMERLSHQGEMMLKKAIDQTDRDIIKEPLTELRHLWENLCEKINDRQHTLEAALLALGQFQHALSEVMSWLTHTEELLDSQRPISSDPKLLEVDLAKHHVLKNDVLAHQNTVETVSDAGNELLQSSAGDDASSLRNRLQALSRCWTSVLQKTEDREQQLELALQQAQGFYGEIEDILQWLIRTESLLSGSKSTGGLPETAREQLAAHMELYAEFKANEEMYRQLMDRGRLMLSTREDPTSESSAEQNVALLERKWQTVSTKMEERKSKLEEALALACEFQNSLQDFINWLTQAEQNLNMAPPASLILDTIFFQIDEHKVFVNEVNQHRDHIIELDKMGNQLKFLSQKQDVVLIKNLLLSVQSRWEKVVQRSVERGRALDDARKRAKQFHEAWKKLIDWLEDAENRLDSEVEISNDPDRIKLQLTKHKDFQKTLGSKQPVYDTTIRTGRALKEKASLTDDSQKLDHLLGEIRDRWDTVCGKSVERQHKLEEALLFSGQFMDALQALVDWLYKVEPQLAEDQPVHGDLDLVMNLMEAHKGFQKELGKRTGSVQALKRSARELLDTSHDDIAWVKVQLQELSVRWDKVCKLSVSKQTRLELALKQAEEFRTVVHVLLEWLSEAEQTLRFHGALPDDVEALQSLIDLHKEFMRKVEEKRVDVNTATGLGEAILAVCHPDCVTTVKHWNTIIRARFEEVLTWARQHQQRLETAHSELVANANLLEELLAWIQWAETTLIQRDQDPIPQNIDQVKELISEHQSFMEEMTQKQPDVDKITKTYKRKTTEPDKTRSSRKSLSQAPPLAMPVLSQSEAKNPRINQLSAHWQQVWLLALERQRKLNDVLDRLEELKEFANFDFDVWRKKYMRWMNHKKSRVMDFFRRIDKDQDGKITRQEFIDGILASKFPTTKLEMTAVADIFDRDGDGYIDYYEFVAALHPNKDAYRPTTDADKIEDEVTRQVAQCKCAKRFQVEQIGENKYRFYLGNQFGDSQQLRLVRILRSTVMVRVGGGWMALDEFLVKNDPCRARGRTNLELREKFILPEGVSQGMTPFRSRGRRSKPSSRAASPTRSSSSASQSNHSCTSMPSSPATPASGAKQPIRSYERPWLTNSKTNTPLRGSEFLVPYEVTPQSAKLKRPTFHSSRTSLTGEAACCATPVSSGAKPSRADPKKTTSRPASRAGSRASSRRGSDASDFDLLETQSACSDTSESSAQGGPSSSRRGISKPSKIPTMSKKSTTTTPPKTPGTKR